MPTRQQWIDGLDKDGHRLDPGKVRQYRDRHPEMTPSRLEMLRLVVWCGDDESEAALSVTEAGPGLDIWTGELTFRNRAFPVRLLSRWLDDVPCLPVLTIDDNDTRLQAPARQNLEECPMLLLVGCWLMGEDSIGLALTA